MSLLVRGHVKQPILRYVRIIIKLTLILTSYMTCNFVISSMKHHFLHNQEELCNFVSIQYLLFVQITDYESSLIDKLNSDNAEEQLDAARYCLNFARMIICIIM